jgi:hypothetical protein
VFAPGFAPRELFEILAVLLELTPTMTTPHGGHSLGKVFGIVVLEVLQARSDAPLFDLVFSISEATSALVRSDNFRSGWRSESRHSLSGVVEERSIRRWQLAAGTRTAQQSGSTGIEPLM